ncbi:MAG: ROK family protein, partial [Oscillospiraceae bacterium]
KLIKQDGRISARTAYAAIKQGDEAGRIVTDEYVKYLAVGIANVINIFQPDVLCIGGGVCNEGDTLLVPLKKAVKEQVYSKNSAKNTEIVICSLGNDAGIIGAAMLHRSCK